MSQATDLERLAQPLFGTFSRAEKAMLEKAVVGLTAYCGASNKADDPLNDPKDSDTWDQERHIRAELLRWLFADEGAKKLIDPRGVRVDSAWIESELSLSFIKAPFQLELSRCRLKGGCRLNLTEIPRVDLTGSWMEFISADHAVVKGDVLLKSVVCVGREVALNGARIGGSLNCDGAQFKNPAKKDVRQSGVALNAVAARIGGAVLFREKFRAEGLVRLYCAQIEGNLECDSGWFENPAEAESKQRWSGLALDLGALKVTGTVSLRKGFTAKGAVNLDYATIGGPLDCDGGTFENAARKDMAQTGVALRARGAKVAGSVSLRSNIADKGSFSAKGIVHLYRAEIGGDLECDGGSFENPAQKDVEGTGTALHAGSTKIGGSVLLRASPGGRGDFSAKGAVLLAGSEIKGKLECDGGKFENPAEAQLGESGVALRANGASVTGDVLLRKSFLARGVVDLSNASIGRNLSCDGGTFENPIKKGASSSGTAMSLAAARVGGGVLFRSGFFDRGKFSAKGTLHLAGAQIEGNLECDGGSFENPAQAALDGTGIAVQGYGVNVTGDVRLRSRFHSRGAVSLYNARIGGSLDCDGGTFENAAQKNVQTSGTALNAGAARVAGGVLCRTNFFGRGTFSAKGMVSLYGAQIEGNLECDGSKFENPGQENVVGSGLALQIEAARVGGSVLLRRDFSADGLVRLYGAQIGGNLGCTKGKFKNKGVGVLTGMGTALNAVNLKVTGDVLLNGEFEAKDAVTFGKARIGGRLESDRGKIYSLDLRDASATAIVDDVDEEEWQPQTKLNLDGFTYERISKEPSQDPLDQAIEALMPAGEAWNIPHRLRWLEQQAKFTRQPYRQLAKVLKDAGDDKGFRKVCMRMEERAREGQSWWRRFWGHVLRWTIGYGYASQRAVYCVLGLILLGTIVYWHGRWTMVPTQKDAYSDYITKGDTPAYYGRFHALAYSVDNSFPLVKLGLQEKWAPREATVEDTARPANWIQWIDWRLASPGFLRCFRWGQVCVGWILTTLFAVGVTGVVRKD